MKTKNRKQEKREGVGHDWSSCHVYGVSQQLLGVPWGFYTCVIIEIMHNALRL